MKDYDFQPATALILESIPNDWETFKIVYRYIDSVADIKTYCNFSNSTEFIDFDADSFALMDVFDDFRKKSHPDLESPWSVAVLTVTKNMDTNLEFDYGDPGILEGTDYPIEASEPLKITTEECYQCIAECMVDSLPKDWTSARMEAEVQEDSIKLDYFYQKGFFNRNQKFNVSNLFAPANAIKVIQENMQKSGYSWSKAVFHIKKDGTYKLEPIV